VRDRLSNLDAHKSMGPDGMHPRVLRELVDVIAEPLSIIFERSWRTREVPEDWRKANVIPIFKKGKKEDPGNYRPVSLTSIPGKVMEQLIPTSPSLLVRPMSSITFLLVGSSITWRRKLSSTHSRNLLDCLCPAMLSLEKMSGWLKSTMRIRAFEHEASPIWL